MKKKKIKADIYNYGAMICLQESCPWDGVCANHDSAGDFRSEGGCRPVVHLENGEVFCETYYSPGDGIKYHECPTHTAHSRNRYGESQILVEELVEKTDNYQI